MGLRSVVRLDALGCQGASGTMRAIAQAKAAISRAMATTTSLACLPRAINCRYRVHRRTCAFQLIACTSAVLQTELEMPADLRRIPIRPRAFDQGAARVRVAGLGDAPLPS